MKAAHCKRPSRNSRGEQKKRTCSDKACGDKSGELPEKEREHVGTVASTVDDSVFPETAPVSSPCICKQPAIFTRSWRRRRGAPFGRLAIRCLSLVGFLPFLLAVGIGLPFRRLCDLLGKRDPSRLAVGRQRSARPRGSVALAVRTTPHALVAVRCIAADTAAAPVAAPFIHGGRGRAAHQAGARDRLGTSVGERPEGL